MIRDRNNTQRVRTEFRGETRTKTDMAPACDINNILARYKKTGLISHFAQGGRYEDLPDSFTFHEAANTVLEAERMFMELPASLRKELDQDPARFLDYVADPENHTRLRELGLMRPAAAEPAKPAVAPAAPPGDNSEVSS